LRSLSRNRRNAYADWKRFGRILEGLGKAKDGMTYEEWIEKAKKNPAWNMLSEEDRLYSAWSAAYLETRSKPLAALEVATQYGGIDGDHHKTWVIDQMVRSLTSEDEYRQFVIEHNTGTEGPNTYCWDEGIAP
jgi:hypothetical protein